MMARHTQVESVRIRQLLRLACESALVILLLGIVFATACGGGSSSGTPPPPPPVSGWTWMGGSSNGGAAGVYGSLGVAGSSNVPGARFPDAGWTDANGNFWLFGGFGFDSNDTNGALNDLWEFSPSANTWTWVNGSNAVNSGGVYGTIGVGAAGNVPGARTEGTYFTDSNHNFWLFGGEGYDSTGAFGVGLNDLWQYNSSTKQWTWMGGSDLAGELANYGSLGVAAPTNVPSARFGSVGWVDGNGAIWLFGGGGPAFNNDLWKFDPGTMEWTWEGGSNTGNQAGVYGALGVANSSNVPGARELMVSWTDKQGNFWLFGGWGVDITQASGVGTFNDLWEYSPSTNLWTWASGSNTSGQQGFYGQLGTASNANVPGARYGGTTWTDAAGNLWMFGGYSLSSDSVGNNLLFNDLWKFDPSSKQWTWMAGSSSPNAPGQYGTLGTGNSSNTPGAREGGVTWVDSAGNLWLFGGIGLSASSAENDLWRWGLIQ